MPVDQFVEGSRNSTDLGMNIGGGVNYPLNAPSRPLAKVLDQHDLRAGVASDRARRRREFSAFQRQAVGGDHARVPAAGRSAHPARAARFAPAVVAVVLDLRVSRTFRFGGAARVELLMDVLNVLNDTAAEALATDNFFSPTFGQPTVFMTPRRVMVGARLNLGQ